MDPRAAVAPFVALLSLGCAGYENVFVPLPGGPPPPSDVRPVVRAAELLAARDALPFRSKEQLLHLFHERIADPTGGPFEVPAGEIARLAGELKTLFPLHACRRIVFEQGLLWLTFDEDQTVPLSSTMGQANLSLSRDLGLALRRDGAVTRCTVVWGGLRLNASGLVRWLYPMARDIQADVLSYTPSPGSSIVTATQTIRVEGEVTAADNAVIVDYVHEAFPEDEDLRFERGLARIFGMRYDLTPPDRVRIAGRAGRADAGLYGSIAGMIDRAFRDPDSFAGATEVRIEAAYDLETKWLEFDVSFR